MTKNEAADYLKISTRTLERYAKAGEIAVSYVLNEQNKRAMHFDAVDVETFRRQLKAAPKVLDENAIIVAPKIAPLATMRAPKTTVPASVPTQHKIILTLSEAAALTGLSRAFLRQSIENGALKSVKIGRSFRVSRAELDRFAVELCG